MAGKPPSGSGRGYKRWNLGQSTNKSSEKKEITQATDDIYNIVEGKNNQTTVDLSQVLIKLSTISIPNKQINVSKVGLIISLF
jgi:hypothetical protein